MQRLVGWSGVGCGGTHPGSARKRLGDRRTLGKVTRLCPKESGSVARRGIEVTMWSVQMLMHALMGCVEPV